MTIDHFRINCYLSISEYQGRGSVFPPLTPNQSPSLGSKLERLSSRNGDTSKRRQRLRAIQGKSTSAVSTRSSEPNINSTWERQSSSNPLISFLMYVIRLGILGVGLGAIAGTALTVINPKKALVTNQLSPTNSPSAKSTVATQSSVKTGAAPVSFKQELIPLKKKLAALATKYPKLQPAAFFVDLDNGNYVDFKGKTSFSAASTIKLPVLIAFFEDVDAGKIRLDEMLTMKKELIGSGSGDMQHQKPGTKFTALETATKMIVISDNTATNMLITRLGGKDALNQRFRKWGLTTTVIRNPLPDLEGTNTTSPQELANLLIKMNQGELVSLKSRDRILDIMVQTKTRTLLPQGLEEDATIAHKTGDIGSILGDAGLIDMPSGKRYIGAVLVKRPHNDYTARTLIQQISQTAYQHFKWYQPSRSNQ